MGPASTQPRNPYAPIAPEDRLLVSIFDGEKRLLIFSLVGGVLTSTVVLNRDSEAGSGWRRKGPRIIGFLRDMPPWLMRAIPSLN